MLENDGVIEEVATLEEEPTAEPTEPVEEVQEVEVTEPQSAEDNSKFAEIRRKYEAETNAIKRERDLLLGTLNEYGYQGSAQEVSDALYAQIVGVSEDEARAIREQEERAALEKQTLLEEVETYKKIAIEKLMSDDLMAIQKVYPEVKSLEELGDDFFNAMSALGSRDPLLAYEVVKAKKSATEKPKPQEIGGVNSSSSKEKDFYTPSEVDKLTDKDYDNNPKLMDIVRQSMTKWK